MKSKKSKFLTALALAASMSTAASAAVPAYLTDVTGAVDDGAASQILIYTGGALILGGLVVWRIVKRSSGSV